MFRWDRLLIAGLLLLLLVGIRMFEDLLFYDPLRVFFSTTHTTDPLPSFHFYKLIGNVAFRFSLNTIISLAILWVLFRDRGILKISGVLFVVSFVVLFSIFMMLLHTSEAGSHMFLFYIRRFLIQPLFLLILIPAVYFQKKQ